MDGSRDGSGSGLGGHSPGKPKKWHHFKRWVGVKKDTHSPALTGAASDGSHPDGPGDAGYNSNSNTHAASGPAHHPHAAPSASLFAGIMPGAPQTAFQPRKFTFERKTTKALLESAPAFKVRIPDYPGCNAGRPPPNVLMTLEINRQDIDQFSSIIENYLKRTPILRRYERICREPE
jgi:hypothetical protein